MDRESSKRPPIDILCFPSGRGTKALAHKQSRWDFLIRRPSSSAFDAFDPKVDNSLFVSSHLSPQVWVPTSSIGLIEIEILLIFFIDQRAILIAEQQ